jgi:hypothetical protein
MISCSHWGMFEYQIPASMPFGWVIPFITGVTYEGTELSYDAKYLHG